jgi:hypothetical protein
MNVRPIERSFGRTLRKRNRTFLRWQQYSQSKICVQPSMSAPLRKQQTGVT